MRFTQLSRLLACSFLGLALGAACEGGREDDGAQLLANPPRALPLGLQVQSIVEARGIPAATAAVQYLLAKNEVAAAGVTVVVYRDSQSAQKALRSPAPGKGAVGLIAPGIVATEVDAPTVDGRVVRCFEASVTAYAAGDDARARECDAQVGRFIVSLSQGAPEGRTLPSTAVATPLLQAAIDHVLDLFPDAEN